jgi:hypothetical protein
MCRIKISLKFDDLSSITSSSNCIPKYISKYKIVKEFPSKKNIRKENYRKTLFLLYYRKKSGVESSFSSIYGTPELENVVLCT